MRYLILLASILGVLTLNAQENQALTASSWEDGSYTHYVNALASGSYNSLKLEKEGKEEIKFIKDEYGFVTAIQLRDKEYTGDQAPKADFIRYYESFSSRWRLFVMNDSRIIIIEQPGKSMRVLGSLGGKAKKSDRKKILDYMEASKEIQKEDIARKAKEETLSQDEIDDVYAQVNKIWSQYDEICFWDYEDRVMDLEDPNVLEQSDIIDENNKLKKVNLILEKDPVSGYEAVVKKLGMRVAYWKIRWIRVKKDGKYGFVNHKNEIKVPIKYDYLDKAFVKGLVAVEKNGKYGYLNKFGKEFIPCIYDKVHYFSNNGLACVVKDDLYGFVNTNGKLVIPLIYTASYAYFYKGIVGVQNKENEEGYINEDGDVVIPIIYDAVSRVVSCNYHNIVQVREGDTYGFMARAFKGNEFVDRGLIYDKATLYRRVDSGNLYAYLAEVEKDGRSYYIDEHGYEVDPESFVRVNSRTDIDLVEEEEEELAESTDITPNFSGTVYFRHDLSNRSSERLHIHYGSNTAYTKSTSKGSKASIKCEKTKVYYSFTGNKKDMKFLFELEPKHCGKTIDISDYVD